MSNLYQFEKTNMIQPDNLLFENYQTSKQDLQRINERNKIDQVRVEILRDANERLNSEVQRLKNFIANKEKTNAVPSQEIIDKERKLASDSVTAMFAKKMLEAEQISNQQALKIKQQAQKIMKLEKLLDDVYESENNAQDKQNDIDEIKRLNLRLSSLINKI